MRKIPFKNVFTLFIILCVVFSCNKSTDLASPSPAKPAILPTGNVLVQLQSSKQNLLGLKLDASIISYHVESELQTDKEVAAFRQKLIADDNMVPQFNGSEAASFSVNTIKERMAAYTRSASSEQNVVQNLQQLVFPMIKKGQKVLDILWQANGKQFHSKCVYDDNGVVYDNMLSNIALTENAVVPADELKLSSASLRTGTTQNARQYSFTATARDVTIKWLWGSTRGKVVIKHYIIWNGSNYIYDHGGSVDAWMSIGSASGRWANNYLSRSSRSKMSWGYGWATPTASFSIKFNSKSITFSASTSGVGSKGSGDGVHTIYLP